MMPLLIRGDSEELAKNKAQTILKQSKFLTDQTISNELQEVSNKE